MLARATNTVADSIFLLGLIEHAASTLELADTRESDEKLTKTFISDLVSKVKNRYT